MNIRLLFSLILLFFFSSIIAQDYRFKLTTVVVDDSQNPIPDVKIKTKNTNANYRTNSNGVFKFNYSYQDDYYLIFMHVGYINDTLFISKNKAKKWSKKTTKEITIQLKVKTFDEVVITAKKVDTVYGSDLFSIKDYLLLDNNSLLLLTYNKIINKNYELILTDNNQKILSKYTIPDRPEYLYKDYSNDYFMVCRTHIYKITIHQKQIKLTPTPKEDFYGYYQRILDTIQNNYYYSNYAENYPAVDFLVTNRLDSAHKKLLSVQDDFMMELYRAQYKYVSGRDKLWAYRKEQETGIDKEIWIGATSFTQDFLYKPIYAPLFVANDTIVIFDQYKNLIYKFDRDHDLVDSIPYQLKIKGNKEKWEQPLIKDKTTGAIYALYNKGGYNYLKKINLTSGKTKQTLKLSNRYVEQLTINNGNVYYIYRPFESLQKKFLYREKITD